MAKTKKKSYTDLYILAESDQHIQQYQFHTMQLQNICNHSTGFHHTHVDQYKLNLWAWRFLP